MVMYILENQTSFLRYILEFYVKVVIFTMVSS